MQEQYVPQSIEPAVQKHWDAKKTFKAVENLQLEDGDTLVLAGRPEALALAEQVLLQI